MAAVVQLDAASVPPPGTVSRRAAVTILLPAPFRGLSTYCYPLF